jgi:hypothetical protein
MRQGSLGRDISCLCGAGPPGGRSHNCCGASVRKSVVDVSLGRHRIGVSRRGPGAG